MLTRRSFLSAGIGLCAASISMLVGCKSANHTKIAIHTWIGYESLFLASQFGWLPDNISLVNNQNATQSVKMLIEGQVQAACLTLDELLLVRAAGVSAKVGLVFNVSAGADMVISRLPIDELKDIKGLRVGYESGALGALILHHLLKETKLNLNDLVLINLPPDQQFNAWQRGDVDIVITYEPTAGLLLEEGGIRIFDSRNMPERIFDILAVRSDLLNGRANNQMHQMVAAHFQSIEYIRRQRQDALYRIATRQQTDVDQVQMALGGVHLPSLESNRNYLSGSDTRLLDAATEIEWLMQQSNLIENSVVSPDMFDSKWLPRLS